MIEEITVSEHVIKSGESVALGSTTTRMARLRRSKSDKRAIRPPPRENADEVKHRMQKQTHREHRER